MTCDFLTSEGYHEGLYKTSGSAVHAHRSCLLPFTCLPMSVLTEVSWLLFACSYHQGMCNMTYDRIRLM